MAMYQDDRTWSKPLCLVKNDENATFQVVESTLKKLREIDHPVAVISIIGPYRSGKSFILNYLAGIKSGFEVSDSIAGMTKGIYVYSRPHPTKSDLQLLFLDTEGLFDVDKDKEEENDTSLFLLATLLSSCLIYNSRGTIDQQAIEKLSFVAEIASKLKLYESDNNSEDCAGMIAVLFPEFVWLVRDFTLTLKQKDGTSLTADEYLNYALAFKEGNNKSVKKLNAIRNRIRTFFANRKCFVLPTLQPNESALSDGSTANIDEDNLNKCEKLRQHVMQSSRPKDVGGCVFNGRRLAALVEKYSAPLAEGKIPCIEVAMKGTADEINRSMREELLQQYTTDMNRLDLPTEDLKALEQQHNLSLSQIMGKANTGFMLVDKNSSSGILTELLDAINKEYKMLKKKNEDISMDRCRAILDSFTATLRKNLDAKCYEAPGGYAKCQADLEEACKHYKAVPNKGVMALEALQEYKQTFSEQAMLILKIDQTMTQAEKDLKDSQMREELLKREAEIAEKNRADLERRQQEQAAESAAAHESMQKLLAEQNEVFNKKLSDTIEKFTAERAAMKSNSSASAAEYARQLLALNREFAQVPPCTIL